MTKFADKIMNEMMSIGKKLIDLRHRLNVTQKDVADFLEIDRKTYANWEVDRTPVYSSLMTKDVS
jgi:DNA-binding XRE family transcriptional regulator